MARADEGGFTTDVYHGSGTDEVIDEFRKGITFTTDSPELASDFATHKMATRNPKTMPLKIKGKYLEVQSDYGREGIREAEQRFGRDVLGLTDKDYPNGLEIYEYAKSKGFDGVVFKQVVDDPGAPWIAKPSDIYATFDPKNIRSKFAKFDPAKKNSANLLAGGAAAAIGLNALTRPERDEYVTR